MDRGLVTLEKRGHTWNYFIGESRFCDTIYADDSDTTSLAMVVLDDIPKEEKEYAMNAILANLSPDGLPYVRNLGPAPLKMGDRMISNVL